ncbi:MAG: phosphatase PAP2 family protein [Roseivirga sp.]|nr:phosphatase PAP2 family protein [Roseivirga sp.]
MFQTELIIWLQSFESPALNWLMTTVSDLGYSIVYGILMTIIIFGFRLKQSLSVIVAASIVGILTFTLKNSIKFPRPSQVDVSVVEPGQVQINPLVENGGATGFWSLPSQGALKAVAAQPDWSYGLPSGHVSAATAFFVGIAFFFRSRGLFVFSAIWVPLMALSRMYLGRHFLADVLGGVLVGVAGVVLAALLLRPLIRSDYKSLKPEALLPFACIAIPLALMAPWVPLLHNENAGRLLGLLAVMAYLVKVGFPSDAGKIWQRALRILVVAVLAFIIDRLVNFVMESTGWEDLPLAEMLMTFLTVCVSFILAIEVLRRLKLYTWNES